MKKIVYILIVAGLLYCLFSCSASWHVHRAIVKDPTILKDRVDTVKIQTREIMGESSSLDSVVIDNDWVYIKSKVVGDSIKVEYDIKSYEIDTVFHSKILHIYDTIVIKKTRREFRYEARQKRIETKENAHTLRVNIKRNSSVAIAKEKRIGKDNRKTDSPIKKFWFFLKTILFTLIGLSIGFVLGRFTQIMKKF